MKKNLIANFLSKGLAGLLIIVFTPLYVRYLGIESYSIIAIYTLITTLCTLFDSGLSCSLNREMAFYSAKLENSSNIRKLFTSIETVCWMIAVFIGILIYFLSPWLAENWLKASAVLIPQLKHIFLLMGIAISIQWPFSIYSNGLIGLQKQVLSSVIFSSCALLRSGGAIACFHLFQPSLKVFFLWQIAVSILQSLIARSALIRFLPKNEGFSLKDFSQLKKIKQFALSMNSIAVLSVIIINMDKVFLSHYLDLSSYGYYSFASTIANGLYLFITPIFTTYFPIFSKHIANKDEQGLIQSYHKGAKLLSFLITPVALVIAFFPTECIYLWTQNLDLAKSISLITSLLVLGTMLNGFLNLPFALQLAYGWTKLVLTQNIISVIFLLPLFYFLFSFFGITGASSIWIIHNFSCILIIIHLLHKKFLIKEKRKWYWEDTCRPLICCLLAVSICRLFLPVNNNFHGIITALLLTYVLGAASILLSTPVFRQRLKNYLTLTN